LTQFPRGLGKGSDAALVGGWLQSVLERMTPADVPAPCFSQPIIFEIFKLYRSVDIWDNISLSVFFLRDPPGKHKTSKLIGQPVGPHSQDMCKDLFNVIKWGCKAANDFFRGVYCGRLWLTRMEAEECIYNGWAMCDPLFALYFYTFFLVKRVCCSYQLANDMRMILAT